VGRKGGWRETKNVNFYFGLEDIFDKMEEVYDILIRNFTLVGN
jgi:hypothetical protein